MSTVPAGGSAYGDFPATTVVGASRTTVQSPFSNQVTPGFDLRKTRLDKHRLNRTIQGTATTAVVNATVAVATDAINTVRLADRVPTTLVNGKRTGRIRRVSSTSIGTIGSLVGGTGYTDGTYNNVPMVRTIGSGSQLLASGAATSITVVGGIVTACVQAASRTGEGYTVGDVLTAATGYIGAGTGFTVTVATVVVG